MTKLHKERVNDIAERELLRRISRFCDMSGPGLPIGFGDDAAVIDAGGEGRVIVTTDAMIEGTHFALGKISWAALGHKAIASNLSDIAAMAGAPHSAVVTLGLTGRELVDDVLEFYEGARRLCGLHGSRLIGGDLVRSPQVIVSVTALGLAQPGAALPLRSRAKPGQTIYVTGSPGESGAGLHLQQNGYAPEGPDDAWMKRLIHRHTEPEPRVAEGAAILAACPDAAMIDVSDGIWNEAGQLAEASGCATIIEAAALPVSPALKRFEAETGSAAIQQILFGGEDYELLFTTCAPLESILNSLQSHGVKTPVTAIGRVAEGRGARVVNASGEPMEFADATFRHF